MKKTDKKPWQTPELSLDFISVCSPDFLLISGEGELNDSDWDTLGFEQLT